MKIIQNAVRIIKTGEILNSIDVHDCVTAKSKGETVLVDGGKKYFRRSVNSKGIIEDLSLTTDNTPEEIKANLLWGTYGKSGKEKFKWIKLVDCELSHLAAILETHKVSDLYKITIVNLILDKIQKYV